MTIRIWYFTDSSNALPRRRLAIVVENFVVRKSSLQILPNYDVYKPSTLRLRNVTHSYDGTYEFELERKDGISFTSEVKIFVASKSSLFFISYLTF